MTSKAHKIIIAVVLGVMSLFAGADLYAASQDVTMTVGETKTLYLPSSVTSKYLKSVNFYSNGISYVDVKSYTNYSVTVEAKKSFSSKVIVRCDYTYYVLRNGKYVYGGTGFYDFNITINDIEVARIELPETMTINVGESKRLSPVLTPTNATSKLTWESSVYSIINVDQTGNILAQREGSSVITVISSNGKSASCTITAIRPVVEVASVYLNPRTLTMKAGETYMLTTTIYPSNATYQACSWSSSAPEIASVSVGKVTALKAGTATIKASVSNGEYGICTVTVMDSIPSLNISDSEGVTDIPTKANVTYSRTFLQGWNSVCLPFAITESMFKSYDDAVSMAVLAEIESIGSFKRLVVKNTDAVAAGVPCLIYASKDFVCSLTMNNVSLVPKPIEQANMQGVFTQTVVGAGVYKITKDGNACAVTKTDGATVFPFRAYFTITK